MKNYFKFLFKYMQIDYFIFCLIVLCVMAHYMKVNLVFEYTSISMIASALMPSKIEFEQAKKDGLIKIRGGYNENEIKR